MTICIIPARSGSKRIKNKNIQKINGIPLIGMTIKIAKKSGLFKRVIVSTDCPKISFIAKKYGAEVPFLRNKNLSNDFTPTFKVLIDAVKRIGTQKEKFHFCIYPTSILINKNHLKMALLKIKKTKSKYIFPIAEFESNPYRSLVIKNNSKCIKCKDRTEAPFTFKTSLNNDVIDVGSVNKYIPLCRKHYIESTLLKNSLKDKNININNSK